MNSADHADRRYRKGPGILPILNRFLLALIVCVVLAGFLFALRAPLEQYREEKARLRRLSIEIENQRAILERNRRELGLLQTDPEYVETVARDKLDLMKEGETVFRIESAPAPIAP